MKESEGEVRQGEAVSFDRSDRALPGEPVWTREPFGNYVKGLSVFRYLVGTNFFLTS